MHHPFGLPLRFHFATITRPSFVVTSRGMRSGRGAAVPAFRARLGRRLEATVNTPPA